VYSFEGNITQQAFLLSKLHYMGTSLVERSKCYLRVAKMSCIKPSTEVLLFIVYKDDDDDDDDDGDDGNDDKNNSYTGKFFSAVSCVKMGFVSNM